jgi:OOP family OmpA-OmpF porin
MSSHSYFLIARKAIGAVVFACASFTATAQQAQPTASGEVNFPSLDSSYLKTESFVGPDHVRRITPGLGKDQVRRELGNPQYSEGLFGVREWDYVSNCLAGKAMNT